MVKNSSWTTTSVPADLAQRIESFVSSREGKKLGYTSKTGFIADALREKLDELDGKSKLHQTKLENKIDEMNDEIILIKNMLAKPHNRKSPDPIFDEMSQKKLSRLKELSKQNPSEFMPIPETNFNEIQQLFRKNKGKLSTDEIRSLMNYVSFIHEQLTQKDKTLARYSTKTDKVSMDEINILN
ncbi:MAG: hypothetical protein KC444_09970, partial [Nitrosopumilus sp.]|nr:hypothetical protein [Nitrosopumilus sp.]